MFHCSSWISLHRLGARWGQGRLNTRCLVADVLRILCRISLWLTLTLLSLCYSLDVYKHSFHFQLGSRVDLVVPGGAWVLCFCYVVVVGTQPPPLLGSCPSLLWSPLPLGLLQPEERPARPWEVKAGLVSGLWTGPRLPATPPAGSVFSIAGPVHWALTFWILVGTPRNTSSLSIRAPSNSKLNHDSTVTTSASSTCFLNV